jgi:hypothetical protein
MGGLDLTAYPFYLLNGIMLEVLCDLKQLRQSILEFKVFLCAKNELEYHST